MLGGAEIDQRRPGACLLRQAPGRVKTIQWVSNPFVLPEGSNTLLAVPREDMAHWWNTNGMSPRLACGQRRYPGEFRVPDIHGDADDRADAGGHRVS